MHKRIHIYISGDVQGVGLRYFLRNKALRLRVNGFVKNLKDGRVEAVFEGSEDSLARMLEFCRRGTYISKVTDVKLNEEQFNNEFKEFEIRI